MWGNYSGRGCATVHAIATQHGETPANAYRVDYRGASLIFSGDLDPSAMSNLTQLAQGGSHENAWKELIISFPGIFSACSMGCEGLILPMALHPSIRFAALAFIYVRYALLHTWRPSSFLSRLTYWRQTQVYHYTSFCVNRFQVTFSSHYHVLQFCPLNWYRIAYDVVHSMPQGA